MFSVEVITPRAMSGSFVLPVFVLGLLKPPHFLFLGEHNNSLYEFIMKTEFLIMLSAVQESGTVEAECIQL